MASLCRKQKCMTERRGDRQALNSWWCKFFHCVGLENILEWLSGSGLLEDLQLFKNCEPAGVSDWSFDENCVFCCLRREAVKEHLLDANSQISGSGRKPLLFEDLSSISRFEWQTEEFLNAVFSRKSDPPRFPDPHIPVVAREIMHRMVRQFAAEYTSKTSFSQASPHRNGNKDQSLVKACSVVSPPPTAAALATASASTHNPVLTRLLMDDQDSPLDLTVKKVEVEIFEQDGVLDLSTKKNRNRESVSFRTPHVSTTTPVVKGDSRDRSLAKVRGLQSASALEQVMAKLCSHHQRQIVDALGFLQTEVKAVASSSGLHPSTSKPVSEEAKTSDCCHVPLEQSSETRQSEEQVGLTASKDASDLKEAAALKNNKWVTVKCPPNTDDSVMVQGYTGPPLDLSNTHISKVLTSPLSCTDSESVSPKGLSPIKIKLRSGAASHQPLNTGTLEENLCNPSPLLQTNNGELHAEPSSVLERDGLSQSPRFKGQRIPAGHTKDTPVRPGAVQRISSVVSPISPRTARKSRRGSYLRPRDGSVCHVINDPDSNCDIVYIGKPITECQVESESRMLPRRNARKSTRGHRYIEEYWELKTVRTLAHKSAGNGSGNCPAPMPDIITLVTPKQALTKPDGVPPLNMPFTGDCMETVIQKATDKPIEREMPGDVVTAVSDEDLVVETSQTGQTQNIDQVLTCPSTASSFAGEEYNGNVPQELLTEEHFANRTPKPADLEDLNMLQVSGNKEKEPSPRQSRVDPSGDPLREPMPDDLPSVAESENQSSTAEAPSSMSLNQTEVDSTDAKSKGANVSLKEKNLLRDTQGEVQSHCVKSVTELLASKEENVQLHKTCETETSLVHSDGDKLTEEKVMITEISKEPDKEATIKETPESHEKLEKPELKQPQCAITKKGSGRRVLTSDRCLRSKVLTNFPDTAKVSSPPGVSTLEEVHSTDSQDASLKTSESKSPLKYFNSKQEEAVLPSPDNQNDAFQNESEKGLEKEVKTSENVVMDNRLRTRQKHKSVPIKAIEMDKEQQVSDKQSPKQTMTQVQMCPPANAEELETINISAPEVGKTVKENCSSTVTNTSFECMDFTNKNSHTELPNTTDYCSSSSRNASDSCEPMPLRSKNISTVEQLANGDSCSILTENVSEKSERMPLRSRNNVVAENSDNGNSCSSAIANSSECTGRMPLRSRSSGLVEKPICGESSTTSIRNLSEVSGRMPLRSGSNSVAEQPSSKDSNNASAGSTSSTPGRMPLRSGSSSCTVEQPDGSATPTKNKKSLRLSKLASVSSKKDSGQFCAGSNIKPKVENTFKDSASFNSFGLVNVEPLTPSPPKFLEALKGEEYQQLISNLNVRFDKMQKGWVQMDKEGQSAPKPKNKADRLKEIWKSKRRIRKQRSLDQQKFSPVQMLFMKSFDLPSICRWFLQSTETKSLVIVKKVNTRLPSETQLCFHTSAAVPGSSHSVFPSVQAERLKKHLKKFAIASPVKSNPKSQKLIAKALARDMSVVKGKEKRELTSATRISTKPNKPYAGMTQAQIPESQKAAASVKNPASARILRKYSNMRSLSKSKETSVQGIKGTKMKSTIAKNVSKRTCSIIQGRKSSSVAKKVRVKSSNKNAIAKAAMRGKTTKNSVCRSLRQLSEKNNLSPKRSSQLQMVPKEQKNTPDKKERKEGMVKSGVDVSAQTKTNDIKTDLKKSPATKGLECLVSNPQDADVKSLSSQDQVLTRSQRKNEATLLQTGSPKGTTKRTLDPIVTPVKRTRTSLGKS